MAGASRQRRVGEGLTNESHQVTFTDVKGWRREEEGEDRFREGRVSVSSYWFICENLLP